MSFIGGGNRNIFRILDDYRLRLLVNNVTIPGADLGWGAHPARAPPKIGKNKIFWRKIVIFHTKYPKIVRASLRSAQLF
jgi:hypothetical protein